MKTSIFLSIFLTFNSLCTHAADFNPMASSVPCLACTVPDGLTVSDLTSASATLSWNAVSSATQYSVEVQDEQNIPSNFHIEVNVNGTSYALTGLQANVTYKFKVRARCGSDKSDWSDWVFFVAGNGGGGSGVCADVSGLSASVTGGIATLNWNAVSGALKYYIEVEDEQNTPSVFHLEDSAATNTYTLAGLQTGVLYKFKVRAHCAGNQSNWSGWVFFNGTGNGPGNGSGTCVAPNVLSANVNGNTVVLSWNSVSGALQYYLEVEDEQNVPSVFHLEASVQDTTYLLTGLQTNVMYKFKVRSHCGADQSDWSSWVVFNDNSGGGIGGGTGNCTRPTGTQVTNITAGTALLSWNVVAGVASYTLEIEREQAGAAPWQINQVVNTNSFLLTGLHADTRYKFKVRSNCGGGGHSHWTKWRKFKTAPSMGGSSGGANLGNLMEDRGDAFSEPAAALQVQVLPNPVHTDAMLRLQHLQAGQLRICLYDLTGRIVLSQQMDTVGGLWEGSLSCGQLPNGYYLLQAKNGSRVQTFKLAIAH